MKSIKGYTLLELVLAISLTVMLLAGITGAIVVALRIHGRGAETVASNSELIRILHDGTGIVHSSGTITIDLIGTGVSEIFDIEFIRADFTPAGSTDNRIRTVFRGIP
ncbi:MAG: prepilin-type N-terminal cleavage/methylation domain-containing protein [Defluviitaleaceae bacterium]|nr:prepilin-type N-terminal cleavage/methylation domain-containing protein [Defluviitaleaceae bacterium]